MAKICRERKKEIPYVRGIGTLDFWGRLGVRKAYGRQRG